MSLTFGSKQASRVLERDKIKEKNAVRIKTIYTDIEELNDKLQVLKEFISELEIDISTIYHSRNKLITELKSLGVDTQ